MKLFYVYPKNEYQKTMTKHIVMGANKIFAESLYYKETGMIPDITKTEEIENGTKLNDVIILTH